MIHSNHRKVKFKNNIYWHSDWNLSPLSHYNEKGEFLADSFVDISYAIIEGNKIKRFGEIIGTTDDLEEIK